MENEQIEIIAKTDEELREIAVGLYDGQIFSHKQVRPEEVGMTFMPILLGAFADKSKEELEDIGLIYEYLDKAAPRCINGNPIFYSCRYLTVKETEIVNKHFSNYKKLKDQFLKK